MENASDALIMAGQILIFIVALTVCISSFSTLRQGVDSIIGETETVKFAKGENGYINYIEADNNKAIRIVGAETVVSSLYRALKENYVVYLKLKDTSNLFVGTGDAVVDKYIAKQDLIINRKKIISKDDSLIKVTIGTNTNTQIDSKLRKVLFNKIKDLSFYEYYGQYQDATDAPQADKTTHRIITYIDTKCF